MKKKTILAWVLAVAAVLLVCAVVVGIMSRQGANNSSTEDSAAEATKSGVISDVIDFEDLWDKATYGQN